MDKEKLKESVDSILSEKLMIILAIAAIPVIIAEYIYPSTTIEFKIAFTVDWIIWFVFLLEFVLKVYMEEKKIVYIGAHKLDSAISIVIIFSPTLGIFSNYYSGLPVIRLIRISKLFRVTTLTQVARGAAYAGKTVMERKEMQKPKQGTFIISRIELRQVLIVLGVREKDVAVLLSSLDKTHRHTNIIVFANLLEKLGIDRDKMANVFRRMGMDDVTISNAFRMVDENKISAETGRLHEASLDMS